MPARRALLVATCLVITAAAVACGRTEVTTGTGAAPGTTRVSPQTPGSAAGGPACIPGSTVAKGSPTDVPCPGTTASTPASPPSAGPGATTPTTCVASPASTAVGLPGGGELVCSSPGEPGGSTGSPPIDTTIPGGGSATPGPRPDATHGVVRGEVGGSACPRYTDTCVAMYRFVPATVTLDGPEHVVTHTGDGRDDPITFGFAVKLTPGRYTVTAEPDSSGDECDPVTVDVVAHDTVNTSVPCWVKG